MKKGRPKGRSFFIPRNRDSLSSCTSIAILLVNPFTALPAKIARHKNRQYRTIRNSPSPSPRADHVRVSSKLDSMLSELSIHDWTQLSREFYLLASLARRAEDASAITAHELSQMETTNSRVYSFIGQRLPLNLKLKLAMIVASDSSAAAPEIQFALETMVRCCIAKEANWTDVLENIKALYLAGAFIPIHLRRNFEVPSEVAEKISHEPEAFPLPLVAAADSSLRGDTGSKAIGLQVIAARDRWFQ